MKEVEYFVRRKLHDETTYLVTDGFITEEVDNLKEVQHYIELMISEYKEEPTPFYEIKIIENYNRDNGLGDVVARIEEADIEEWEL